MRIGFVGGHGHHYLKAIETDPRDGSPVARAACGDGRDDARATILFKSLPGAIWFSSLDQLLTEFSPDVLSVGAVYALNGDVTAVALARDVPVVSDKPVAATWRQLETLRRVIDGTDRRLLTEFDFRCRRDFLSAREWVARGQVGQIVLVTGQKSYRFGSRPAWYADRASYGGTLLWILSHAIDVVPFVTGLRVTHVTGAGGNVTRPDYGTMEDHVTVTMRLENGATAVLHADFLRPASAPTHGDDRLRVAGSSGVLEVRDERCTLTTSALASHDVTETVPAPASVADQLLAAATTDAPSVYSTRHSLDTAHLLLKCRDAADARAWVDVRAD